MSRSELPARQKRKRKRNRGRKQETTPQPSQDAEVEIPVPSEPKDEIFETVNDYIRYSMNQSQSINLPTDSIPSNDFAPDNDHQTEHEFHSQPEPDTEETRPDVVHHIDSPESTNDQPSIPENGMGTISDAIHAYHKLSALKPDDQTENMKASDYLRHLRKQGHDPDDDDSSVSGDDTPPPVEDPLLTLLRIEAKEADKPTTIEYDDRVFDKKIFQDEEFKEYRKNNVAINDGKRRKRLYAEDEDNIVHLVTHKHDDDDDNNNNQYIVSKGGRGAIDPEMDGMDMDIMDDMDYGGNAVGGMDGIYMKLRPNYFVALKITDVRMKRKLKNAQSYLMNELEDDRYQRTLIDESMFHITINAIHCRNDEEVFLLMDEFERFGNNQLQRLVPTKLSTRIHVRRIGHFRQKVIYGEIEDDANRAKLENIYHALHTQLQNAGIINQQHRFDPHVTIMKLSKIRNNKHLTIPMEVIKKMNTKYPHDFGWQYVNGLELLSMVDARNEEDAGDYYQCISSIAPAKLR